MPRSGYTDDFEENWSLICWRGAVKSALRGKRGQEFLRELVGALDALPEKELITDSFQVDGAYCALGAVGRVRGLDMDKIDPYSNDDFAEAFGLANAMAREIMWVNDEGSVRKESPRARFERVRSWVIENIAGDL